MCGHVSMCDSSINVSKDLQVTWNDRAILMVPHAKNLSYRLVWIKTKLVSVASGFIVEHNIKKIKGKHFWIAFISINAKNRKYKSLIVLQAK